MFTPSLRKHLKSHLKCDKCNAEFPGVYILQAFANEHWGIFCQNLAVRQFIRFFEIYNRFTSLSLKKSASLLELESKISDIFGIQWKPVARLATGFHWRNKDHMRHLLSTWLLKTKRNHFHAMNATTNVLINLIWRFIWEDTQGCAPSYNLGDKLLLPNVMVWTNTKRFFHLKKLWEKSNLKKLYMKRTLDANRHWQSLESEYFNIVL